MVLSQKYQSQSTAVASYDYKDIDAGTGYVIYYGGHLGDGSTSGAYILSNNDFYSQNITTAKAMSQALQKFCEMTFTLKYNRTQTNLSGSIVVSGSARTTLATFKSDDFAVDDDSNLSDYTMSSTKVTIEQTQLKSGDILELNLEGWSSIDENKTRWVGIGHDPKNRNDPEDLYDGRVIYDNNNTTFGETVLNVHIPYKLDI